METSLAAKEEEQSYEEFEPFCKWQKDQENDILEIHLPAGFRRQDIRVRFNDAGIITITGKQGSDGVKSSTTTPAMRSRFHKEVKVSRNCRPDQIRAKFSLGILSITLPSNVVELPKQSPEDSAHNLLSKERALKMVLVSLATVLAGYAIYRLCII